MWNNLRVESAAPTVDQTSLSGLSPGHFLLLLFSVEEQQLCSSSPDWFLNVNSSAVAYPPSTNSDWRWQWVKPEEERYQQQQQRHTLVLYQTADLLPLHVAEIDLIPRQEISEYHQTADLISFSSQRSGGNASRSLMLNCHHFSNVRLPPDI